MKIECPHCGKEVSVNGLGRRRLNLGVKNVCDALRSSSTVVETAKKLHCSRGYVYKILKEQGILAKSLKKQPAK